MSTLLLKGGTVIDPGSKRNEVSDVLIENGIIQKVGKNLKSPDAEVYDATGKIVTPGCRIRVPWLILPRSCEVCKSAPRMCR